MCVRTRYCKQIIYEIMKKLLQKNYDFKALGAFLVIALLLFDSTSVNALFSAIWPFTSGLISTPLL